jgi:hypothetical protein
LKIHFNIIFPSTPGLPSGLLPSGFHTKTLYAPIFSPVHPQTHSLQNNTHLLYSLRRTWPKTYRQQRAHASAEFPANVAEDRAGETGTLLPVLLRLRRHNLKEGLLEIPKLAPCVYGRS